MSEAGIAAARARHGRPNLEFHFHDATRPFPIPDGSADVVFSSEVIEHLADGSRRFENRLNPHHVNSYSINRLRAEVQAFFEARAMEGLTYDLAIERRTEERPDPAPPPRETR